MASKISQIGTTVLRNSGTKILHISLDGAVTDVEPNQNFTVVPSSNDYLILAGDNTQIAIISHSDESSLKVDKGEKYSGAKFDLTINMDE